MRHFWPPLLIILCCATGYLTIVYDGMCRLFPNFRAELVKAGGQYVSVIPSTVITLIIPLLAIV